MIKIYNQKGYTLLELIITIGLIAIAISVTGFGLNAIYTSNINSHASQLVNEIRLVQTKEMSSLNKDYKLILSKSGSNYIARTTVTVGGVSTQVKLIKLPNGFTLKKLIGSNYVEIGAISDVGEREFAFDAASGRLITDGDGKYQVTSTSSSKVIEFGVIKQNGRVYVDE